MPANIDAPATPLAPALLRALASDFVTARYTMRRGRIENSSWYRPLMRWLHATPFGTPNDNARQLQGHRVSFRIRQLRGTGEHQAFLCKQSSTLYWHSEFTGDLDELPDDIDDSEKYVQIPGKKELDLGKPLVLDFARHFLPDNVGDVQEIFSKRGAYARFNDLLQPTGALDLWYAFEANAEGRALRTWCDLNLIEVGD
ncbi:hypothetical protein NKH23_25535 [Mesorhizobium sp. M1328]|uniref:hypothetical protein n=1 Tax=Mesorhizobium sp. M1328 TaxID=2957082 RepID=UPI00333CA2F5